MRDISLYVKDMLNAMDSIESFIEGLNIEQFTEDDKTSSAVIRKFEVMGEASKSVPESIRKQYAEIPWKEMSGMRDRLIHAYFGVDYQLVWATIKDRFPTVRPLLHEVLKSIS